MPAFTIAFSVKKEERKKKDIILKQQSHIYLLILQHPIKLLKPINTHILITEIKSNERRKFELSIQAFMEEEP